MESELKRAIIDFMFENQHESQLLNVTGKEFYQYIYTPDGDHCIGGKKVSEFINAIEKLIKI